MNKTHSKTFSQTERLIFGGVAVVIAVLLVTIGLKNGFPSSDRGDPSYPSIVIFLLGFVDGFTAYSSSGSDAAHYPAAWNLGAFSFVAIVAFIGSLIIFRRESISAKNDSGMRNLEITFLSISIILLAAALLRHDWLLSSSAKYGLTSVQLQDKTISFEDFTARNGGIALSSETARMYTWFWNGRALFGACVLLFISLIADVSLRVQRKRASGYSQRFALVALVFGIGIIINSDIARGRWPAYDEEVLRVGHSFYLLGITMILSFLLYFTKLESPAVTEQTMNSAPS